MTGGTPSRLKCYRELRRRMDKALDAALPLEEAKRRGLVAITRELPVRLWDNVLFAIQTSREMPPERQACLVSLREGRSIQVWAMPVPGWEKWRDDN